MELGVLREYQDWTTAMHQDSLNHGDDTRSRFSRGLKDVLV